MILGHKKSRVWSTPGFHLAHSRRREKKFARSQQVKKLVFRYRQKIFTTNNHYEWSK